jgi:hypothetical protein
VCMCVCVHVPFKLQHMERELRGGQGKQCAHQFKGIRDCDREFLLSASQSASAP